mmetsp:Transcript_4950/g.15007  ORF Transcript_4950/g.15007 Transcript_4950/m.15007 type:complete len:214 (-) Transcript_4950:144-785(-)
MNIHQLDSLHTGASSAPSLSFFCLAPLSYFRRLLSCSSCLCCARPSHLTTQADPARLPATAPRKQGMGHRCQLAFQSSGTTQAPSQEPAIEQRNSSEHTLSAVFWGFIVAYDRFHWPRSSVSRQAPGMATSVEKKNPRFAVSNRLLIGTPKQVAAKQKKKVPAATETAALLARPPSLLVSHIPCTISFADVSMTVNIGIKMRLPKLVVWSRTR